MRLYEFAPSPDRDNESNGPDYIEQLANRWWNAADPAKQDRIAAVLRTFGYSIRQTDNEIEDEVELTDIKSGHRYYISADTFDPDLSEDNLKEFAPAGGDDREPNEEEILHRLASQWWQGDEDPRAERTLAAMGWEIGQDEGYDNGGAFVVRAGDVNGNSFISWPAEELEDLEEGWKSALGGAALAGAMALGGGAANAKMTSPVAQAPAATTAQATAPAPTRPAALTQQAGPVEQLKKVAMASGIQGTELAQFLAQCAHESANFASMEERGSPAYFTKKYEQHKKTARILGNKVKGDGERYKGRGYIQLTGRDNYTRAGAALGLPLAQQPDLAARPDVAAKVAVWYWQNRVAPKIKDFSNTGDVTKKINPASNGLQSRQDQFKSYQVAMR